MRMKNLELKLEMRIKDCHFKNLKILNTITILWTRYPFFWIHHDHDHNHHQYHQHHLLVNQDNQQNQDHHDGHHDDHQYKI